MCEIKKMLFLVSAQGNPLAQIWVDDADVTKNSESIYIALNHQVAYLFFLGVGSKINLKKNNKGYYNVEVPDFFTNLFEGYKTATNETIKTVGSMLNMAFKNAFNSIEFLKNGEVVKISRDEANDKCKEYLQGYTSLYNVALDFLSNSKIKALKQAGKILEKEDSKAGDVKEANQIVMQYIYLLSKEVIAKNNFMIEDTPLEEVEEEKPKKTTKKSKKAEETSIDDEEIPF